MYKLKSNKGYVNAATRLGNDFVEISVSIEVAQSLLNSGKMVESDRPNYPICINYEWYFEGEEIKKASKKEK